MGFVHADTIVHDGQTLPMCVHQFLGIVCRSNNTYGGGVAAPTPIMYDVGSLVCAPTYVRCWCCCTHPSCTHDSR